MEKPITRSPQFWAFSSHIFSQSPQNLQVKFLSLLRSCQLFTDKPCWFVLEFFRHSCRYDLLTGAQNENDLQRSFLLFRTAQTTCKRLSASSLKHFWSILCASVAVFPRRKQKLKQIRCSARSDITISRDEIDNTWKNWQNKLVQLSIATSAWLLTCEGCKYTHLAREHSTTIRKSSPKPVLFFGVPPRMHISLSSFETTTLCGFSPSQPSLSKFFCP
jgi:hypothetical protein